MNTLQQIEQLLLPIWNKIYNKEECPKSFIKLMTNIIPKYKDNNFDSFLGKIKKMGVIQALRKTQIDLIEFRALNEKIQENLNNLINIFQNKFIREDISKFTSSKFVSYARDINEIIEFKEEASEILKNKLKNRVLIDIGAGPIGGMENHVLIFVKKLDVKSYIAVELYHFDDESTLSKESKSLSKKYKIKISLIKKDMLTFLNSLPDNFGNILISGIDDTIIPETFYRRSLVQEIVRVIPKGGIIINKKSLISDFEKYLPNEKMKLLFNEYGLRIYEKIKY